ncbi:long-chain fatty acid--CoA ligase, partial [Vibrio vulnificus]
VSRLQRSLAVNEVVVAPNEPMNIASIWTSSAEKFPDRTAIKMDDVELSYTDLDQLSQKLAGLLAAKGVGCGDRIALICPNLPYMPVVFYGALRA